MCIFISEEDKVVLNMCEENYLTFTDTLYLTLNDYTKDLTECQCWVNWGAFSLIIMDLRLNSRNQDTSSDNELLINKHHYKCNPQSESYGAIFGDIKMFNDVNPDAMISLKSTSSILKPEMVWIAVVPEGNIFI